MKKLIIFLTLLLYLAVSGFSLADFHKDSPQGKQQGCLLCIFANTPLDSAPEYVLPEQQPQSLKEKPFQEIVSSSLFRYILPSNRAPPAVA
jgi:hypothetical protein